MQTIREGARVRVRCFRVCTLTHAYIQAYESHTTYWLRKPHQIYHVDKWWSRLYYYCYYSLGYVAGVVVVVALSLFVFSSFFTITTIVVIIVVAVVVICFFFLFLRYCDVHAVFILFSFMRWDGKKINTPNSLTHSVKPPGRKRQRRRGEKCTHTLARVYVCTHTHWLAHMK